MRSCLLVLLVAAACAHAPPSDEGPVPAPAAPQEAASDALSDVRAEARALIEEQTEVAWRRWALGEDSDLSATYAGHEGLFTAEAVARSGRAAAAARGDLRRALDALRLYQAGELVARGTAALAERAEQLAASSILDVQGRKVAYLDVPALAAREPDAQERGRLCDAELPVIAQLAPMVLESERRASALARKAGFPSYQTLAAALRGVESTDLVRLAESVLAATDSQYAPAVAALAQRELGLDRLRWSDLGRLFRAQAVDGAFPAGGALPAAQQTLRGLGIDLAAQKNVLIHAEPLPGKNARAVALPVRVPDDIRVSVKPQGGVEDYRALLHELGHAEHYAHTRVAHWELGLLGSNVATEAYGFLFEGLVEDPGWLGSMTTMAPEARPAFLRDAALHQLYYLRRAAARVVFDVEWRGGRLADPAARWRELAARACACALSPEDGARFVVERDEFLHSADELRARLLAAQLELALVARGGSAWWTNAASGALLRELWAEGMIAGETLAARVGAKGVDAMPLVEKLLARL